jgi:hypothetical protein
VSADDRWEPFELHKAWGIFHVEAYDAEPLAVFSEEEDATEWLEQRRQHADEDKRLTEYHQVFPIRGIGGRWWNSYDEVLWSPS